MISPFKTLLTQSYLAKYVKHCGTWMSGIRCRNVSNQCAFVVLVTLVYGFITEIREIPYRRGIPHATFLQELSRAFMSFTNLETFVWLCSANASLPPLLKHLGNVHRLRDVQIHGQNLSMSQAKLLTDIKVLSALTLEEPSTSLMRVLCNWVGCLGGHLTSLTLKVRIGGDNAHP
jgi:hypothetical protein